jgi:hypothetical protein
MMLNLKNQNENRLTPRAPDGACSATHVSEVGDPVKLDERCELEAHSLDAPRFAARFAKFYAIIFGRVANPPRRASPFGSASRANANRWAVDEASSKKVLAGNSTDVSSNSNWKILYSELMLQFV